MGRVPAGPRRLLTAQDDAREYDDGHGGPARARAAATALDELFDEHLGPDRRVLDLAAGPGSVARLLRGAVVALDHSPAFTTAAAAALPGRTVRADATAVLPLRDGSLDAVATVWWLHMAPAPAAVVAEVARVLRPGGVLATTVDKLAVDEHARGSPSWHGWRGDATVTLVTAAAHYGLELVGARTFPGHGHPEAGADAVYPVLAFSRAESTVRLDG